jgi:hypothetical protein
MLGFWPADGNGTDVVGGNNAQINGAMFAAGVTGQAFSFDGLSSVSLLRPPALRTVGDWTYSLWINIASYQNGAILASDGSYFVDRTSATSPLVSLKPVSDTFGFQVRYDDGTGLGGPSGGPIARNVWTHVAMQRKAGIVFSLYVDGTLVGTVPDSGGPLSAPAFKLGRHESLGGFVGLIDDLKIYDFALAPAQIGQLAAGRDCH